MHVLDFLKSAPRTQTLHQLTASYHATRPQIIEFPSDLSRSHDKYQSGDRKLFDSIMLVCLVLNTVSATFGV